MGSFFGKQKVLTKMNTDDNDNKDKIDDKNYKSSNIEIIESETEKSKTDKNNSKLNYVLNYLNFGYEEKDEKEDYKYRVYAFGDNDYGCVSYLNKCETYKLFVGNFQCVKGENHKYYSWGLNNYGQLGQESYINYLSKNTGNEYFFESYNEMYGISKIEKVLKVRINIDKMSFGDGFSVAVTKTKHVYSWGRCDYYQLGKEIKFDDCKIINNQKVVVSPILIYEFNDDILSIYSGKSHTLILLKNKKVYGWGDNNKQQIYPYKHHDKESDSTKYYITNCREISQLSNLNFNQLKTGWSFSAGISNGNQLIVWGSIEKMYYKDNIKDNEVIKEMLYEDFCLKTPENIISISSIAVGFEHVLFLTNDNCLYSFGNNSYVSHI